MFRADRKGICIFPLLAPTAFPAPDAAFCSPTPLLTVNCLRMVRFDVRPELTLHGNNETSARVNFRFNHGPNQIDVRVADRSIKNGNFTTDGVFLALRNGQGLELEYGKRRQLPPMSEMLRWAHDPPTFPRPHSRCGHQVPTRADQVERGCRRPPGLRQVRACPEVQR